MVYDPTPNTRFSGYTTHRRTSSRLPSLLLFHLLPPHSPLLLRIVVSGSLVCAACSRVHLSPFLRPSSSSSPKPPSSSSGFSFSFDFRSSPLARFHPAFDFRALSIEIRACHTRMNSIELFLSASLRRVVLRFVISYPSDSPSSLVPHSSFLPSRSCPLPSSTLVCTFVSQDSPLPRRLARTALTRYLLPAFSFFSLPLACTSLALLSSFASYGPFSF